MSSDNCSVAQQISRKDGGMGCAVAKKTRETLFSGDDQPRLWTGEAERTDPNIDATEINVPASERTGMPIEAYVGSLRVDYDFNQKEYSRDIVNVKSAIASSPERVGQSFSPDEMVTLKFDRATITFFLKQMLGGALGVNYVAPDDLPGQVTFRTEQPVPKGRIIQIVRDVLARNGLEIRYIGGIYQIGRPDTFTSADAISRSGRVSEQSSRLIQIRKGSATEISALVRQLTTDDVVLLPTNATNSILVKAAPADMESVVSLIDSLDRSGVGENKVAIIPLRQSSPEKMVTQLLAIYQQQIGQAKESLTILPLETQQSILVVAKDPSIMGGIRQMVTQLDRDSSDEQTLRIIPLTHLIATDVAQQLSTAFVGVGGSAPSADREGPTAAQNPSPSSAPNSSGGQGGGSSNPYGTVGTTQAGATPRPTTTTQTTTNAYGTVSSTSTSTPPARPKSAVSSTAPGGGGKDETKFIPDTRTNSILVYSSYAVFKRVQKIVKALDVPQAQVVIEATIVQVNITDDLQYGVQWFLKNRALASNSPSNPVVSTNTTTLPGLFNANMNTFIGNVGVQSILGALQSVTKLKVISSPYVSVLDGKSAHLVVGDQIPYITSNTSITGASSSVTTTTTTKETGIVLDVTPKIMSDNSVLLTIDQSVTKPGPLPSSGGNPTISTQQVRSDVVIQSGRTVLLGGLMTDSVTQSASSPPGTHAIPFLSSLFNTNSDDNASRQELLIMITPRVTRQTSQLESVTKLLRDQLHVH